MSPTTSPHNAPSSSPSTSPSDTAPSRSAVSNDNRDTRPDFRRRADLELLSSPRDWFRRELARIRAGRSAA